LIAEMDFTPLVPARLTQLHRSRLPIRACNIMQELYNAHTKLPASRFDMHYRDAYTMKVFADQVFADEWHVRRYGEDAAPRAR